MLYESVGTLNYKHEEGYGYRLVVDIDPEISRYYRSLIPKWHSFNSQMYSPHISVVRHETPARLEFWEKYQGDAIQFVYSNVIQRGEVYWWLNVFSKKLEEIRIELGLPVDSPYTRPPDGFEKCFHTTLANSKPQPSPTKGGRDE
jgi:hypothetical protein